MVWSRCQTQSMSFMAQLATCLTDGLRKLLVIGLHKPSVEGGL